MIIRRQSCSVLKSIPSVLLFMLVGLTVLFVSVPCALAQPPAETAMTPFLPNLNGIVVDQDWAKIMGKALYWDTQVGSDGQACASCHFQAFTDSRTKNQLSPDLLRVTVNEFGEQISDEDHTFGGLPPDAILGGPAAFVGKTASGNAAEPNYELQPGDFPFLQFEDNNRNGTILASTNDRLSSQGSYDNVFASLTRTDIEDMCTDLSPDPFNVCGLPSRAVEPRNTPTSINAVFNHRNFWDTRAKNTFNGKDPFGLSSIKHDPTARIIEYDRVTRTEALVEFAIRDASLASQAVGPPLSELEMTCTGRTFEEIGRKILSAGRRPLQYQKIHAYDSLLGSPGPKGSLIDSSGEGLRRNYNYKIMIMRAFDRKYWASGKRYRIQSDGSLIVDPTGYTQMEYNFSMFWGVSLMLFQSSLISNQSRFDTALASGCIQVNPGDPLSFGIPPRNADACVVQGLLTQEEADGLRLFDLNPVIVNPNAPPDDQIVGGRCAICHAGNTFSGSATTQEEGSFGGPGGTIVRLNQSNPDFEEDPNAPPLIATMHDFGHFAVGTRPPHEDPGMGGTDPWGEPLSNARQYKRWLQGGDPPVDGFIPPAAVVCGVGVPPLFIGFGVSCDADGKPTLTRQQADDEVLKTDAAFKTPGLRNVALTPPYFHYGGYSTLEQVIDFYARGGSRRDVMIADNAPYEGYAGPKVSGDTSGTGPNGDMPAPVHMDPAFDGRFGRNVDDAVTELNLRLGVVADDPNTPQDEDQEYGKRALVAFLKTLTDPRVQNDKAPFDHPDLTVPVGHYPYDNDGDGRADEIRVRIPECGQDGYTATYPEFIIPNSGNLFASGMQNRVDPSIPR